MYFSIHATIKRGSSSSFTRVVKLAALESDFQFINLINFADSFLSQLLALWLLFPVMDELTEMLSEEPLLTC